MYLLLCTESALLVTAFQTLVQGLSYTWTCSVSTDGVQFEPCTSIDGDPLEFPAAAVVTVRAGFLAPSATERPYIFTLSVGKAGKVPAAAAVSVIVRKAVVPEVSIETTMLGFQSDGSLRVATGERLVLQVGRCKS